MERLQDLARFLVNPLQIRCDCLPSLKGGFVLMLATACTSGAPTGAEEIGQPAVVRTISTSEPLASMGRLGGVAAGPDGAVYVSNFDRQVWRVGPDGRVVLLTDQLQGSSGNTVDAEGRLLQASFVDGRVVAFDSSGAMSMAAEGLEGPVGLAINADGDLIVCNCQGNSLSSVSADGTVRVRLPTARSSRVRMASRGGPTTRCTW